MSLNVVNKTDGSLTQVAGTAGTAASRITYDDTSSSLGSSNVQGAIDNLTTIVNTKQASTDNNLTTTAKTVVGAINEVRSGLINVQADVKLNTQDLTTGSRTKNLLPITVSGIKEKNTTGTWDGDTYTENGISFAIQKDSDGKVTGITANGTASEETYFVFAGNAKLKVLAGNNLILNGSVGGTTETYLIQAVAYNGINSVASRDGDSVAFTPTSAFSQVRILIANGVTVDNVNFYPMIRLASVSDATFVPYIPSVESRIEAVESGLINVQDDVKLNTNDLTTPSRSKNILPITLDILKRFNTRGTWNGNTYTNNGTVYVVSTNSEGYVTKINVSGTPQGAINYFKLNDFIGDGTSYILSGCPYNGQTWSYAMFINFDSALWDKGDGVTFNNVGTGEISIRVAADYAMPSGGLDYYPMIRPATITDPTFAPYIPSVESRLDAVESGLNNKISISTYTLNLICLNDVSVSLTNGDSITDISAYIPSGYQPSFVMACPANTSTIAVTGCKIYNKTNIEIKCRADYTGTTDFNILLFVRKTS